MKYIRTVNNIYQSDYSRITKVTSIEKNGEEHPCLEINLGYSTKGFPITRNERILKESDYIEDLCDCFIIERTNGEHIMFKELPPLQRHYDLYCREYHHIAGRYGCIWVTGKGLIYVAKMKENGEFELL